MSSCNDKNPVISPYYIVLTNPKNLMTSIELGIQSVNENILLLKTSDMKWVNFRILISKIKFKSISKVRR